MVDYLLDQFVQQIDYSVELFGYDFVIIVFVILSVPYHILYRSSIILVLEYL